MFLAEKTTQAAAKLVQRAGGKLPYIAVLKLLYLADKEMLLTWGVPMTYDQWFSMRFGPVLSNTFNLIRGNPNVSPEASAYWTHHIRKSGFDLQIESDPGDDLLSEAEDAILEKVFTEHGAKNKWALVDMTHELPEWNDPGNSSIPITYQEVLRIAGLSSEAIDEVIENIHAEREIAQSFASAV